ncbi:DMT family transporter [Alphaproteobacteria bacterium]|nr:DMT family transporter [Alphaproteobacteria bacterium]
MNSAPSPSSPNTAKGIIQICIGMLIIPVLDVFAKLLGGTLAPVEVTMMRFVMQALLMLPLVVYLRLWNIPKGTLGLQCARGVALAVATVFFFAALQHLPMAEAISIFFVQPMILTIFSVIFLGEVIRARRIIAIIIGLIGTMIIVQPSVLIFGKPALYPLASAVSMAFYMVFTRKISGTVHPFQMQFIVGVVAVLVLGATLIIGSALNIPGTGFIVPTSTEILWIIGMGLAATLGHAFIVWAMANAPASLLAPFAYVEIIGATFFGYLIFNDIPATSTIFGVTIIIASGLYLFYRERQLSENA